MSLNERDKIRTAALLATANVLKAQAEIDIVGRAVKSTQVARGGLEAQVKTAQAQVARSSGVAATSAISAATSSKLHAAFIAASILKTPSQMAIPALCSNAGKSAALRCRPYCWHASMHRVVGA